MKKCKEVAAEIHGGGFNCAQAVLAAFSEKYGLDRETALKVTGGMGGGFRSGEICGAAAGAVQVIGLKYGQTVMGDMKAKAECGAKTVEFIDAFKKRNEALTCRDILRSSTIDQKGGEKAEKENNSRKKCLKVIENAVEILEELGY